MAQDQLFYVGQKAVIEKDGKVLILNIPLIGADLPGGKIQIGEFDFGISLKREVLEETGLVVTIREPVTTGYFKFHPRVIKQKKSDYVFIVAYVADYRSGEVVLSAEHESYLWVSEQDYQTIDDKNGLIKKLLTVYFDKKKTSK
ncbi:MAG: NUDIX domain-containing protein [Candidatus Levyibacteriota bacterium]